MRRAAVALLGVALICGAAYWFAIHFHLAITTQEPGPAKEGAKARPTAKMPVYPHEAEDLPVNNIADLVAVLIPAQGFDNLAWDYMIDNAAIRWVTDGVDESETGYAARLGYVRVRVAGLPSTRIRAHREELAWTITLGDDNGVKSGPKWIRIQAGIPPSKTHSNEECFG